MPEKVYPNITAVNDRDEVVGYYQLPDVLAQGLLRRISAVFIFNEVGRVLMQRRSALVLSPNLLDFSAAGHVDEGDTYLSAATREVQEELGLSEVEVQLVTPAFRIMDMFTSVYKVVIPTNSPVILNPEEVTSFYWVSVEELETMIDRHPSQFAEPFLAAWPFVCDKIKA
jgi:isopentenyldiphosphate isomerase